MTCLKDLKPMFVHELELQKIYFFELGRMSQFAERKKILAGNFVGDLLNLE